MPPLRSINIDVNSPGGIIHFKEWFTKTFPTGTLLYFKFYCLEEYIDHLLLSSIQKKLYKIYNNSNYRTLISIDSTNFSSIFKTVVDSNTEDLIIDFWKYYYSVTFFVPINDLTFDEFEEYESLNDPFENDLSLHEFEDFQSINDPLVNGFYQTWLWHKLTDRVYIKSIGGEEILISSYKFNV